jgi:hypothetical protein
MQKLILSAFAICILTTSAQAHEWNTELQWNLCENSLAEVADKLEGSELKQGERDIYYYDTDNLDLYQAGMVIRERIGNKKADLTIKVKNLDPSRISDRWLSIKGFKCEYDLHGDSSRFTCSLKSTEMTERTRAIHELVLTPEQESFVDEFSGVDQELLRQSIRRGVLKNSLLKLKSHNDTFDIESYQLGDFFSMEISTRVTTSAALHSKNKIESVFADSGLQICDDQNQTTESKLKLLKPN